MHLRVKVESDVGQFLFDVTDNLALSRRGERVATLRKDLHHVVCKITAGEVEALDGVRKRVALIDGDSVRDAIA